jgi:CheY-like chemotaxis protein
MRLPLLLVVDDVPEVLLIVRRYCERAGNPMIGCADVSTAWVYLCGATAERSSVNNQGEASLVAASAPRPDLVLLDVNLPGVSGLELCRRIRTTPTLADLAVALFGQWSQPGDVAAGLDAGIDFMVAKDVLRRSEEWQARIDDLQSRALGRPSDVLLNWKRSHVPRAVLEESVRGLNEALERLSLQRLGSEVVPALLRRAFRDAKHRIEPTEREEQREGSDIVKGWLREDGAGLDPARVVAADRPDVLAQVALALLDRFWCLVGTRESEGFARALYAGVPLLAECLSHS